MSVQTEENARIKAYRPKYDSDNRLSQDWELASQLSARTN